MPLPKRVEYILNDALFVAQSPDLGIRNLLDRQSMAAYRWFKDYPPMEVKTLVDLGAHHGLFSQFASKRYNLERVVSVEPLPSCAAILRTLNLPNHTVVEAAIGDEVGSTSFHVNATAQSSSVLNVAPDAGEAFGLEMKNTDTIQVKITTLDEVYKSCDLERVDLIKIDVQGLEREVIKGGGEALKRTKAVMMEVLLFQHYEGAAKLSELHNLMEEHGFMLSRFLDACYDKNDRMLQADLLYLNSAL